MFKKDEVVTVQLDENNNSSNTYRVFGMVEDTDFVILYHPMNYDCMIIRKKDELNKVQATLKDSTERAIDFALKNQNELDYNYRGDLEALTLYYVVNRALTNHQKNQLSNICGTIASIHFHNDVDLAREVVNKNSALLSPFNRMWFDNFKDIFSGKKPIVSPKQRVTVFNIAGSVLAELQRNETYKK